MALVLDRGRSSRDASFTLVNSPVISARGESLKPERNIYRVISPMIDLSWPFKKCDGWMLGSEGNVTLRGFLPVVEVEGSDAMIAQRTVKPSRSNYTSGMHKEVSSALNLALSSAKSITLE